MDHLASPIEAPPGNADFLKRLLRGQKADPDEGDGAYGFKPFQEQCEKDASLVAANRVNLVYDDMSDTFKNLTRPHVSIR